MLSSTCTHVVAFRHLRISPSSTTRLLYQLPFEYVFLKINKFMSVVTIPGGHFMNSVFVNPVIYSCAVDAFVEISTHLFYHMCRI